MLALLENKFRAITPKKLIPYLVLGILIILSLLAWRYYLTQSSKSQEHLYSESVASVIDEITKRLHQHEMILKSGAGIFIASEEVTRDEWKLFFEHQVSGNIFPALRTIFFSKIIEQSELESHLEEMRSEGLADYSVWPDGERSVYAPIVYKESPDTSIQYAIGFDMYSVPQLSATLLQARDSDSVILSELLAPMATNSGNNQQAGAELMMAIPVYAYLPTGDPSEEHSASVIGYISDIFRLEDLMHGILPDLEHPIDFKVYDGTTAETDALLYDSRLTAPAGSDTKPKPLFTSHHDLEIYGRHWTLIFEATPAFKTTAERYTGAYILLTTLLTSFLVFFYLQVLQATGEKARILAVKMTAELRKNEEQLKKITDNVTAAVIMCDLEGIIYYASPQSAFALHRKPEELIGKSVFEIACEDDLPKVIETFRYSIENAVPNKLDCRVVSEDGGLSWIEIKGDMLYEDGRVTGVVLVARDITDRKQLEEQISESRKMYRSVVDTQKELISRCLPDTTITFVNDAYCRFFGKSRKQLLGTSYLDYIQPEFHAAELDMIASLTPANPIVSEVQIAMLPGGRTSWVEWTDTAIFDEQSNLMEIQSVGRDITDRKQAEEALLKAYDTTIEGWGRALDLKDEATEGHSQKVAELTVLIAEKMGMSQEEMVHARRGALLHDIGKMGIPDSILLKPGKLTSAEWEIMRKHPVYAYEMLAPIDYLKPVLAIPYCHHEKWDGSGYPRGLKGTEIPLAARIFAVVDVFDALTSDRPYRKAWSREEALEQIKKESNSHFDPQVLEVFLKEIDTKPD